MKIADQSNKFTFSVYNRKREKENYNIEIGKRKFHYTKYPIGINNIDNSFGEAKYMFFFIKDDELLKKYDNI